MLGCKLFSDVSMGLSGKENINATQTDGRVRTLKVNCKVLKGSCCVSQKL